MVRRSTPWLQTDANAMRVPVLAAGFASLVLASCTGTARQEMEAVQPPSADSTTHRADGTAELESAARDAIAFLRGELGFDRVHLADTVVLYLSPEGGGARTRFTREQLRDPASWKVVSGGHAYSFVPPPRLTKLTTRAGRHFNCGEYPLASRYPELARLPHAGVKLEPEAPESCLQAWNVTFVYDPATRPLRLVAAVYDQWEW
jgi:catechol 2,3-dioxygenase-like lactoylglutathione lyase family enzyme